ncbi:MAG: [ribosomal protein S18]-alanine N-acetyltransferase [Myxococcales bacterium]|jgi:ribosomal-protein-alanine N-acetyltransferase|nr:[ribosomal protein S18]-alanine N-acetyltransferase [Myxococcales bacterium]
MALNKAPQPFLIEPMKAADLDTVMEIERVSFRSPWSRQVFLEELTRDWAHVDIVRDAATGEVVGFANYWLVADEVHVLNLATHPQARRAGHASRMMAHMIDFARRELCRYVTLEVRRSNAAALRLYRRFAFRAIGVRPNYYAEDQEDAIVMLLDLG